VAAHATASPYSLVPEVGVLIVDRRVPDQCAIRLSTRYFRPCPWRREIGPRARVCGRRFALGQYERPDDLTHSQCA
jgi:hypothetical protein